MNVSRIQNTMTSPNKPPFPNAPSYKAVVTTAQRFGSKLKDLRTQRGLTQLQLAMAAGIDRSFLSEVERGFKEPGLHTIQSLADAFNMSMSDLLSGI